MGPGRFLFGVNPVGTLLSNKSDERVKIGGFWDGVEEGWQQAHPDGYGRLGLVRGTLDGTPLDSQFPIAKQVEKIIGENNGQIFGKNAYATEGWCVSNRGWEATMTFCTLESQQVRLFDADYKNEITQAKPGQTITIELKAALNQDWNKADKGWVDIRKEKEPVTKLEVNETGPNTGLFTAKYQLPKGKKGVKTEILYGYMGFEKNAIIMYVNKK